MSFFPSSFSLRKCHCQLLLTKLWFILDIYINVSENLYVNITYLVICFGLLVFFRYFDDIDDEMDPEIEEAYEKFCIESEHKRKQ